MTDAKLVDLIKTRFLGVHPDELDCYLEYDDWTRIIAALSTQAVDGKRKRPELLSSEEKKEILLDAEALWRDLQKNNLGGFSDGNRPFYILHAFKSVIEKYGRRDVGLTWSKDDLDALGASPEQGGEGMKLNEREIDFLTRVRDGRPLRIVDRPEDRARQRMSKAGYAECVMGPRRWIITDAGRAALRDGGGE